MAKDAAKTYAAFIDAIALPMVILTAETQVQMANSIGQRLLDAGQIFDVHVVTSRVSLTYSQDTRALKAAIAAAQKDGGPHAFQCEGDEGQIAMCVCPYRPALAYASDIDKKLLEGQELSLIHI